MKAILKNKATKDFVLYFIVGGLATIVEWAIFFVLNQSLHVNHLLATAIAFIFSTFANWGFGRLLVFKHSHESLVRELSKIYAASIIGLIINECIMYLGVDLLGAHAMLIKIIATGVAFFWNFLIRKLVIYNDGQKTKTELFLMKHKGIIISIFLVPFLFFGIFNFIVPTADIDNLGGTHSWLSGSTIKFVNYWLEDGPENLKFTNYEKPNSIESSNLEDREPYLSYPTGETMFVYLAAKLAGKGQITISFLRRFQMILFALEGIMMTTFVYLFSERTLKLKKDYQKVIISVATATLWILMPTCAYYLNNIYFVDQCVIFWTTALILIEYIFRTSRAKSKTLLKILRAVLIYCGILIDYYFWILAFIFFVTEIISTTISQKGTERKKAILSIILWFGVPTILALLTFYLQISQTENWLDIIKFKFGFRVVGEDYKFKTLLNMIRGHFMNAFTIKGSGSYYYLVFTMLASFIVGLVILIKNKCFKKLFINPGISIFISIAITSIGQILIFKQHSALHEFSMTKMAYIVAFLPIIIFMEARFLVKSNKNILPIFITSFLAIVFITGVPFSSIDYVNERLGKVDYTFEEALRANTDYNDIVFSFTKEIPINPPQYLVMSHKLVYKIKSLEEINETISKYAGSHAVLVIEKYYGQKYPQPTGEIKFENDQYIILKLN